MKTQTAVEWLIEQYIEKLTITPDIVKQALDMEKQQITDAARTARQDDFWEKYKLYEDYYDEIYSAK